MKHEIRLARAFYEEEASLLFSWQGRCVRKDVGRALVCERDVLLTQAFLCFCNSMYVKCGFLVQLFKSTWHQIGCFYRCYRHVPRSPALCVQCLWSSTEPAASILPASTPRGAPQQGAGAIAGQPSASSAAPESAGSWSPIAIGAALGLLAAVATTRPALAADLENGEAVFQGNCTACHAGGNNSIVAEKKLKKDALVTYGKYDVGAIITQVTNGNGSMPAFGDKLGPDDIEEHMWLSEF